MQPYLPKEFGESLKREKKLFNEGKHPSKGSHIKFALITVEKCSLKEHTIPLEESDFSRAWRARYGCFSDKSKLEQEVRKRVCVTNSMDSLKRRINVEHTNIIACKCGERFDREDYFDHSEFCTAKTKGNENMEEIKIKIEKKEEDEIAENSNLTLEKLFQCKLCNEKVNYPCHAFRHLKNQPFVCSLCGYSSRWRKSVAIHIRIMHVHASEKPFVHVTEPVCDSCDLLFNDVSHFKDHWKLKHALSLNKDLPSFCTKSCKRNEQARLGVNTAQLPRYTCKVCGKSYREYNKLTRHMYSHSNPSFSCPKCHKKFHLKEKLTRHLRNTHEDEDRRICDICGMALKEGSLKKHKERFHFTEGGERKSQILKFACSTCGKMFSYQSHLNNHQAKHFDIRKYQCSKCPKSFKTSASLQFHLKYTHSSLREFKCNLCDASFKQKPHLLSHSVSHSGTRNFVCSFCGKGFGRKCGLRRHMLLHTEERPFACEHCSKTFIEQSALKKHLRVKHESKLN